MLSVTKSFGGHVAERIGRCPLPVCFPEWREGSFLLAMGIWILVCPVGMQLDDWLSMLAQLHIPATHLIPLGWGLLLIAVGIMQLTALTVALFYPEVGQRGQHISAVAAFIVGVAVTVMVAKAGLLLLVVPLAFTTLSEGYIAKMLRP